MGNTKAHTSNVFESPTHSKTWPLLIFREKKPPARTRLREKVGGSRVDWGPSMHGDVVSREKSNEKCFAKKRAKEERLAHIIIRCGRDTGNKSGASE